MQSQASTVVPRLVTESETSLIDAVIRLADQNRATLGLMPRGAFREFAAQGGMLAACDEAGALAGYALFSVARGRVRLIHLCVADDFRRRGVAARLVEAISKLHGDLAGILLKCRRDFAATRLWEALGFEARNEVPGRSKDRAPLVVWWLSHNIPDLFSTLEESARTPVAIDHNVFVDLAIDRERPGADESQALEADWISEQITLTVTRESRNEILDIPHPGERKRQRGMIERFAELSYGAPELVRAREAWRSAVDFVPQEDLADCNHIISAAAGGAHIFVTRDERLLARYSGAAAETFDMRIMRPSDLVAHLDEIANAERYRPVELRGTGFTVEPFGAGAEATLDRFLDRQGGERKSDYRRRLRQLIADAGSTREWVRDPHGTVIAVWTSRAEAGALTVDLLRVDSSSQAATVGRLISLELRLRALALELDTILIRDSHVPSNLRSDLQVDGYMRMSEGLVAAVINAHSQAEVESKIACHAARDTLLPALRAARTLRQVLALERALWPAKLLDTDLPNYLVPIRPVWASELLGVTTTLTERPPLLGISREHVYYRTPRANPRAPARLAWYASGTSKRGIGAVVAVSHLIDVDTDDPRELFRRYRRLGAYQLSNVTAAARNGVASALRFVDTEVLAKPVPIERLRTLDAKRQIGTVQSPTAMDSALFAAVYREGAARGA